MSEAMDRPIERPWWQKNAFLRIASVAGALVLVVTTVAAFLGVAERSVRLREVAVTIAPVEEGIFRDFVPLRGRAVPRDTIYLDALEGGQVEKVLVRPGDEVTEGQPLVVFRNSQLELEVHDRLGRLVESITQLQAYQTQLETNRATNQKTLTEIDYNIVRLDRLAARQAPLAERGYIAAQAYEETLDELEYNRNLRPLQVETIRTQNALREAQLPRIESEIESLQHSLDITRNKLDDLTVRAPVSGLVTMIDLKIGETRGPGDRLAEIIPDTGFKVAADIDEFYRERVRVGQHASAEIGGKDHVLRVTRIYPLVQNGVFTAELEFENGSGKSLVPGAAVLGRLSLGDDTSALVAPAGGFLESTGGNWVFVVDPDGGSAHRRVVTIGRRNAEQVEILSGLEPGERIVTSAYSGLERIERIDFTD